MFTIEDIYEAVAVKKIPIEKIYKEFGGFSIYIPKVAPNHKEKIIEEFNGKNHHFLATKYNVSLNTVRQIIRDDKKAKRENKLF